MARLAFNRLATLSAVALLCSGALFSACSSDSNNEPTPSDHPEAGTGAKPSTGGKGGTGAGGAGNSGGSGNKAGSGTGNTGNVEGGVAGGDAGPGAGGASPGDSGSGGTAGSGTGGSDAGPPCTQDPKKTCGTCPAVSTVEFLNHCTDSKCIGFDNTKLEKLVNGKLPDLP